MQAGDPPTENLPCGPTSLLAQLGEFERAGVNVSEARVGKLRLAADILLRLSRAFGNAGSAALAHAPGVSPGTWQPPTGAYASTTPSTTGVIMADGRLARVRSFGQPG